MVWPRLKVFWSSKENPTGHSERKKKKRQIEEVGRQYQRVDRNGPFPGCLRLGLSWFNWWVSFAPEFQCCYFCEPSCLFYLSFNFDFYVSKIMHL